MLFSSWSSLGRIVVLGVLAYIALVFLLRISGKRTLTKLNAFDLVITVAFGSTLATILLSKTVTLADGVVAFAVLVFLQYAVAWSAVRSRFIDQLVKSEPAMLFYRGEFLRDAMRRERVTEGELLSSMRSSSAASIEQVEAVVLETDGSLSVISRTEAAPTLLEPVRRKPDALRE